MPSGPNSSNAKASKARKASKPEIATAGHAPAVVIGKVEIRADGGERSFIAAEKR
jgi:hypothetical protein